MDITLTVKLALNFVETTSINTTFLTDIKLRSTQLHTCHLRYPYTFYKHRKCYRFLNLRFTLLTKYELQTLQNFIFRA
jgi:hypothetical protein